jgi:hypothetical protein
VRQPDIQGPTVCDSTDSKCPKQANPEIESRSVVNRDFFRNDENVTDYVGSYTSLKILKTTESYTLKWVYYVANHTSQ